MSTSTAIQTTPPRHAAEARGAASPPVARQPRWEPAPLADDDGRTRGSRAAGGGSVLHLSFRRTDLPYDPQAVTRRVLAARAEMDARDREAVLRQVRAAIPADAVRRAAADLDALDGLGGRLSLSLLEKEAALRLERYRLERRPLAEIEEAEAALAGARRAAADLDAQIRTARDELDGARARRKREAEAIALRHVTESVERDKARRAEILERLLADNGELFSELADIELRLTADHDRAQWARDFAAETLTILENENQ